MSCSTALEEDFGLSKGQARSRDLYPKKTQRGHPNEPKDTLVTRTLGYLDQKTKEARETKEQNNHLAKTNAGIDT